MRAMLSPALAGLNRDALILDPSAETSVDLDAHRATSELETRRSSSNRTPRWRKRR
jgi:hypothetical protein